MSAAAQIIHSRVLRSNGQGERERRPLAYLAPHPDLPSVQLDELLGQRQAQPGALLLAGVVGPT